MAPRKRASSDQIRDEAKRNVRPTKHKSTTRRRPEGPMSSSRRSSPGLPPMINTGGDDNSELEDQNDLSTTDIDEENIEDMILDDYPRQKEDVTRGKKKISKDTRTMALSAGKPSVITIVS